MRRLALAGLLALLPAAARAQAEHGGQICWALVTSATPTEIGRAHV